MELEEQILGFLRHTKPQRPDGYFWVTEVLDHFVSTNKREEILAALEALDHRGGVTLGYTGLGDCGRTSKARFVKALN